MINAVQGHRTNSIQEAMQKAGFIIANVAALDKKQGSFKAVTSTTAVKQDLVISAYKPSDDSLLKHIHTDSYRKVNAHHHSLNQKIKSVI